MRLTDTNVPTEFKLFWQRVVNQSGPDINAIARLNYPHATRSLRVALKNNSLMVLWEPIWDSFDHARRVRWENFWGGWPGSGYSSFVQINAPRYKAGLALLLDPPETLYNWDYYTTFPFQAAQGSAFSPTLNRSVVCNVGFGFPRFDYSNNNYDWFPSNATTTQSPNSVVWFPEGNIFVAVGSGNFGAALWTSTDGINWTNRTLPSNAAGSEICYSPELGLLVMAGSTFATAHMFTSNDGINWTVRYTRSGFGVSCVCWDKKHHRFLALFTDSGQGYSLISSDGINWTLNTINVFQNIVSVAVSVLTGTFALATANNPTSLIFTSDNGINWIERAIGTPHVIRRMFYVAERGLYYAVGQGTTNDEVLISNDAINWQLNTLPAANLAWVLIYNSVDDLLTVLGNGAVYTPEYI